MGDSCSHWLMGPRCVAGLQPESTWTVSLWCRCSNSRCASSGRASAREEETQRWRQALIQQGDAGGDSASSPLCPPSSSPPWRKSQFSGSPWRYAAGKAEGVCVTAAVVCVRDCQHTHFGMLTTTTTFEASKLSPSVNVSVSGCLSLPNTAGRSSMDPISHVCWTRHHFFSFYVNKLETNTKTSLDVHVREVKSCKKKGTKSLIKAASFKAGVGIRVGESYAWGSRESLTCLLVAL